MYAATIFSIALTQQAGLRNVDTHLRKGRKYVSRVIQNSVLTYKNKGTTTDGNCMPRSKIFASFMYNCYYV